MSRRLYLGSEYSLVIPLMIAYLGIGAGLPTDARPEDVQKHFDGYGKIVDCRVMTGNNSQ